MLKLPKEFKDKYRKLLGTDEADEMFTAMNDTNKKSFRINPLKFNTKISYSKKAPVPNLANAYYGAVSGQDPEWVSGTVYSQDPSAMFPAKVANVQPGERVLDLCAAPGGKSTGLGEDLKGQGVLVANEISRPRAKVLRENLERWGVSNVLITSESPEKLAPHFLQFFDKILVDAPCSGEGMFRKNPEAIKYWSEDYVLTCQKRQKEILKEAVKMLRPGGELIYSTCTFSPEEDEQIVAWLVKNFNLVITPIKSIKMDKISHGHLDWAQNLDGLQNTLRFWPQDGLGEGQFIAKLTMPGVTIKAPIKRKNRAKKKLRNKFALFKDEKELVAAILDKFNLPSELNDWPKRVLVRKQHVFIPALTGKQLDGLKILSNGLELGILKKKRFEPGHQLALVLGQVKQERVIDLPNQENYQSYLHGETVKVDSDLRGFILISCHNLIFSFGKIANNGVIKNYYPKGLRTLKKG